MAAPYRSDFEIAANREEITRRYLRRESQYAIAASMGMSRELVAYDLRCIQKKWQETTTWNLNEFKSMELDRIDVLERTYWEAWVASQQSREISIQELVKTPPPPGPGRRDPRTGRVVPAPPGTPQESRQKAQVRKEGQVGNPAFLAGVQWCIDRRAKMLGLDAPDKLDLTTGGGKIGSIADLLTVLGPNPVDQAIATQMQNGQANGNGHKVTS